MDRLGLGFTGAPFTGRQLVEYAKLAEAAGFDSLWLAEDYYLREVVSLLGAVALATEHIRLGPGVINPYTRSPVLLAETLATLDELAGGRSFLALGTGVQPLIEAMGIRFSLPLTTIRESVQVIRQLLQGGTVSFEGRRVQVKGVELGRNPYFALMGSFTPLRRNIPIYVAAIGPRMLQLAGELGDGVLLTAGCSPAHVREALNQVRQGAERSGRSLGGFEVAVYVMVAPSAESRALRGFLAFALTYATDGYLETAGVAPETVEPIRRAFNSKGMAAAAEQVSREHLDAFSATGTISDIVSRLEEYRRAGATLPVVLPIDADVPELIKQLGQT
jgi:5,10-methylenetetrahydromethanopterin reductase